MKDRNRVARSPAPSIPRSLTGRLLLGSAAATLLALASVLVLMHMVLTRFVTGQIDQRLDNKIVALMSQVRATPDGRLSIEGEADGPPFDRRHSRSFWVVLGPRNTLMTEWLRSTDYEAPSSVELDEIFARPHPTLPGPADRADHPESVRAAGFGGIVLHERVARTTVGGTVVTILVAAPVAAIDGPVREAMTSVGLAVFALGLALCALAFAQVRVGLRPLASLRTQVAQVGHGRRDLLPSNQPSEVAPLVEEMNRLLARNAADLEKARRHVANLAHGLKTPLATLQLGLGRLEGPGKADVERLLAQIDLRIRHHLGRARAGALAAPERARTILAPRLADLGYALSRVHADRAVTLALDANGEIAVACEAHDVDEIFGNLLDNAFQYARSRVDCIVREEGRHVRIEISDDGKGLAPDDIAVVLQPGRRLDEHVPGFGFGLTITRELVELYGGELRLDRGNPGLLASVVLPSSGRAATR